MLRLKPGMLHKYLEIASNLDILSFSIGEPDFQTLYHIRQAAIDTTEQGKIFYTSAKGILGLRKDIASFYGRKYHLSYDPAHEIMVTVGASEAIELSIRTLLNPGDEVLVVAPVYLSYGPLILMAGGILVTVDTFEEDGFKLTAKALAEKLSPKTRLIILKYPNNPTSANMTMEVYQEIAEFDSGKVIRIITDEIYSELNHTKQHASLAHCEGMRDQVIILNGFSKTYAIPCLNRSKSPSSTSSPSVLMTTISFGFRIAIQ